MKSKLFTLFLAFVASVGTMSAADIIDGIAYNLNYRLYTAEVTEGGNYSDRVVIPKTVNGFRVTSIGNNAFSYCYGLTSVTIPNSVTSIGYQAFRGCGGLISVTVPNSVTSIGSRAFYDCTGLISATIPNSVTSIGNEAFYNCASLTSLTIPNSVTSIGGNAFYDVPNIVYNGPAAGSPWDAKSVNGFVDGYLVYSDNTKTQLLACCVGATGEVVIPNSVTGIRGRAFSGCTGLTSVSIPKNVTNIDNYTFKDCSGLTSITIPNSVTSIGYQAFYNCAGLTSVTIPNSVTSIGYEAFYNVPNIVYNGPAAGSPWDAKSVNGFVEGYLVYGDNTKTQLLACCVGATGEVVIPNSVTGIRDEAFKNCNGLTSITIPNSVTSIGNNAFYNVLNIIYHGEATGSPWGAKSINGFVDGYLIYSDESKTEVVMCSTADIGEIVIPNSVTSIGNDAFRGCAGLTSVTIPNSVTSIGSYAFNGCSNLNVVYIGNSVISIGQGAFTNCPKLYKIIMLPNSVPSGINNAFQTLSGRITYVGNTNYQNGYDVLGTQRIYSNLNSYFSVDGIVYALANPSKRTCDIIDCDYSGTTTEFVIGNSVVYRNITLSVDSININAFRNNKMMTKLVIDYDHALPSHMASYCSNLTKVIINNLSDIDSYAFYESAKNDPATFIVNNTGNIDNDAFANCSSIDTLIITSKGAIGSYAFSNCSNKFKAYYNINNKGDISPSAFVNCDKLYNLIIGDSVKNIGASAFYQCVGIANAEINNNGPIGQSAFQNCIGLENLIIKSKGSIGIEAFEGSSTGSHATYIISNTGPINKSAFANCTSITNLLIDTCVGYIGQYAFQKCYGLKDVTIKNNGTIEVQAFEGASTQHPATYVVQNVGQIGNMAFANCTSMADLVIDSCVTIIDQSAFRYCTSLENVTIKNMGDIGETAFEGSSTGNPATYVICNNGQIGSSAFANCTSMKNLSIDTCVTSIEGSAFRNCSNLKDVTIKNRGNIGGYAFEGSSMKDSAIYVISNVGEIRSSAFANCTSLYKVRLGNQISSIDESAFSNCVLLDSITLPNSVTTLGASAFYNCQNLAFVKLSNQLSSIGNSTFAGCNSLPELFIPKSVSSIDNSVFQQCTALAIVGFEDSATPLSLGRDSENKGLFYDCPLDSVYIGRELTYPQNPSDGYSPFYRNPSLRSIVVANFPTKVENNEFYGCTNLYSVYIGNGVQSIGEYAFSGCSSIDYFSFGNQVQTIGAEAFSDCVSMTKLYSYCQTPPICGASALADIDKWNCTLYIPETKAGEYASADQWMDFFFIEENEEGGEGIKYTISVDFDATKGNVTGAGVYNRGAEAVLVATPAEGCIFIEWEDGSTEPERHIDVFKSATYMATFSAPKYELYNGTDEVVKGVSAPNCIEIDHVSYPNAIAYSYLATSDINLQDNVCGLNDEGDWYADNIVLTDAQPFYVPNDVETKHLSYVRTFEDYNWQALYVPFDMKYSEFSNFVQIAYLNNVHQYDDDDNGVIDRTVIECISLVDDNVEANWPYIVKPNSMGKITFNADNTTLHATEGNEVECQSVFTRFNVFGTYQNTDIANKYIIANGEFRPSESSQSVSPFRLYLIVSNKYASTPQPAPMRISLVIDGHEETDPTDVEVLYEDESTGEVYDVLGRPTSSPSHGIFIRNGEKIFVR